MWDDKIRRTLLFLPFSSAQHFAGESRGQAERAQGLDREAGVQRDRLPRAHHPVAERGKPFMVIGKEQEGNSLGARFV